MIDNFVILSRLLHTSIEDTDDLVAKAIRDVTINLSSDEVEMVKKALDYYGDKIADSEGYSSGEAYWNLIELFKN